MPRPIPYQKFQAAQRAAPLPAASVDEILKLFNEARWDQLESKAKAVARHHPAHLLGWRALGAALLNQGKLADAVSAFTRVTQLTPADAGAHNDLGVALYQSRRLAEAETSYRRAIQAAATHAVAYSNLGVVLAELGRLDEALASHERGLELDPARAESHSNRANVLRALGRLHEAEAGYRRALQLNPGYFEAQVNLGMTLNSLNRIDDAQLAYRRALALRPDSYDALLGLGNLLSRFDGNEVEGQTVLERCIALNPAGVDAYVALGNLLLRAGQRENSQAMFRTAQRLRPMITRPARRGKPAFSVVMLDSGGAGCTPLDYLTDLSNYDRHFYCVMPEPSAHVELLKPRADVVVNMIADADNGADILPHALVLADLIGKPIVNHPRRVMDSGREAVARRLAGIPLCRVPRTLRFAAAALKEAAAGQGLEGLSPPLLVRLAGTHGGDVFEKFDDVAPIAAFVDQRPEADFYVTEFVDYRSADGWFRKYRFICIDGQLLPYHLAIHDHWMVHHFRTDMANQAWMRQEEEAFLADSLQVFDAEHQAAILKMAQATGLDYCGLDVALDNVGQVVLFETNAAMLVHDETEETFAYKNRYIAKIKQAFDAMLTRMAGDAVG